MATKSYQVKYRMELGQGDGYGIAAEDIPKGMDQVGKQSDWIKSTPEGLAVFQSLKGNGFDIVDVGTDPVYKQVQRGETVWWVPYAKYYNARAVHYIVRYIPLVVSAAPQSVEDMQADLEQHKAEQAALLEQHKAEQQQLVEQMKADLELQKAKLQGEMELNKLRKEMADLQNQANGGAPAAPTGYPGAPAASLRTYEVFGMINGQKVPLAQVAANQGGRYVQVPGSRILVGDAPSDGFGLAGVPGAWATLYPGQSPANYGLDPDKAVMGHDGTRGWVLPASLLSQAFGPNWRSQIYG